MNEDDTFNSLKRIPFNQVIENFRFVDEDWLDTLNLILRDIDHMKPSYHWDSIAMGWDFDDFKMECIKRRGY